MASRNPDRSNILFILSDDQGCWTTGYSGNIEIETPRLDGLAAGGLRMENFFCASPVCSPARASLLTGRIPSQHGIHDYLRAGELDRHPTGYRMIEYLQGLRGYTDLLDQQGYRCGISGKWHVGAMTRPQKGFRDWATCRGGRYYQGTFARDGTTCSEPRYITEAITENALAFLDREADEDRPFYLSVHYTAPHHPWDRDQHPHAIYDRYYNDCPFASAPEGLSPPDWAQRINIPVRDPETRRRYLSGYYTAITAMDRQIGRLLDRLEQHGLLEHTLIVFMSDNGMNMGHHGIYGKGNATFPLNMFEESVKIPCLFFRPGHVPAGATAAGLHSQYDFMPTLLDYIGIENPGAQALPGNSFADLLRGRPETGHDCVVVYDEYGPVRMVRTPQWKYVHRYQFGPHELYDLAGDPGETRNLAGIPEYAETAAELRAQLTAWFLRYVDPAKDGAREGVTGAGQLGLCGAQGDGSEPFDQRRYKSSVSI